MTPPLSESRDAVKRRKARERQRLEKGLPSWARGIHGNVVEFAPDIPVVTPRVPQSPERRLAAAIFQGALDDLRRVALQSTLAQRRVQAAQDWVLADDRLWPFSFVNVCDYLGICAEAVRAALIRADWRPGRVGPRDYVAMPGPTLRVTA